MSILHISLLRKPLLCQWKQIVWESFSVCIFLSTLEEQTVITSRQPINWFNSEKNKIKKLGKKDLKVR